MKRLLPLLLIPMLLSCGKSIYRESHTFPDQCWQRFEAESFTIPVRNIDEYYDIYMTVTFDTAQFREREFPLVINMTTDEGEVRMFYSHIRLFDPKTHQRIGTLEGSRQTATSKVRKYLTFNRKGDVHLDVKQGTSKYEIHGIERFGVEVKKAQMELPN